jgi:LacI family transcriptional regulator
MKKVIRQQAILQIIGDDNHNQLISTRSLSETFNVSESTIRRDFLELSDTGQIHKQYGGATSKQQHGTQDKGEIGLLLGSRIDRYRDPFYNLVLEGADRKIQQLGYRNAYIKTFYDVRTREQAQELLTNFPTDGIIILGSNSDASIQYIREQTLITATVTDTIGRNDIERTHDSIMFDGEWGINMVVQHLANLGHTRLGFITGQIDARYMSFVTATNNNNLATDIELLRVVPTGAEGWVPKFGGQGAKELMNLPQPPDAIVCASDRLAIGAMQWLHQHGYNIPQDIAVTGFDNIPDSDYTFPPLTTVNVHKELLGELAVERIVRRIENPNEIPLSIIIPTSLVIRQSCGNFLN